MFRAKLLITGKVQGVFYRQSMKAEAAALGLFGWVQNLSNGAVEAEVFGDEDKIKALVKWCNQGPERAIVEAVQSVEYHKLASDFIVDVKTFSVR
ncbi:MAG: acylphosphatase [Candidatus Obscuribacterales bacterium]|nr:acylphosphatase [Candidatus Obscuribacterales bacterium]